MDDGPANIVILPANNDDASADMDDACFSTDDALADIVDECSTDADASFRDDNGLPNDTEGSSKAPSDRGTNHGEEKAEEAVWL